MASEPSHFFPVFTVQSLKLVEDAFLHSLSYFHLQFKAYLIICTFWEINFFESVVKLLPFMLAKQIFFMTNLFFNELDY